MGPGHDNNDSDLYTVDQSFDPSQQSLSFNLQQWMNTAAATTEGGNNVLLTTTSTSAINQLQMNTVGPTPDTSAGMLSNWMDFDDTGIMFAPPTFTQDELSMEAPDFNATTTFSGLLRTSLVDFDMASWQALSNDASDSNVFNFQPQSPHSRTGLGSDGGIYVDPADRPCSPASSYGSINSGISHPPGSKNKGKRRVNMSFSEFESASFEELQSLMDSPKSAAGNNSPPSRQRMSPARAKSPKTIMKKSPIPVTKKDVQSEKRVGRRRGPLRPEQRRQAHEIRKLRACLRCKFLKKTCDKGDPCSGCQLSHSYTRLWQVPCARIDIKDIAYFMKDWKADYERHISLEFSIGNIKGFSPVERPIYVTHGYGYCFLIMAREVYVRDDKCFGVDWCETSNGLHFEIETAKLSAGMEGISRAVLSDYLDRHIDGDFEQFIDEYFEGTYFVTEILKTAYRFYYREKSRILRKALKFITAYCLTLHVTMVEGLVEDPNIGKVEDQQSKLSGKTIAPVMINFQVKCAMADMWRELQKDVLEELSALFSSVYSGDKLKNWPIIFLLSTILLAVWELIQFDCNYRVPDQAYVQKFCNDMESTPVGVIVGLFSAISQKLPAFSEWNTHKHRHIFNFHPVVCDTLTEVREHVVKYETYLQSRNETKFDRSDFNSLSNKLLSKLVIRAS